MKIKLVVLATLFALVSFASYSAEDDRELIELTPELQERLLAEMRQLTYDLDELVAALAEGEFEEVRKIAVLKLGFGHNRAARMLEAGQSEEEVVAAMEPFLAERLKMYEAGSLGQGQGGQRGGMFGGLGQHLPENMRAMGQAMHASAVMLAMSAKKAGENPTVDDYKAVLTDLQGMTSMCAGCHQAFKIR